MARFFSGLPGQIDHVMVTAGTQYYAPLAELDFEAARRSLGGHLLLPLQIGRDAAGRVQPANLAVEIAPVRVNVIAAGSVVRPEDVASLAVHLMTNTAITGATYDIDGDEQFVSS